VASDDSSFVNGTDFLVDGGLSACYVVSDAHTSADRGLLLTKTDRGGRSGPGARGSGCGFVCGLTVYTGGGWGRQLRMKTDA
jgi:hypothetical protein